MIETALVTTLKRQATLLIHQVKKSKSPLLITEYGKPAAYLVDVKSYQDLQAKLKIMEAIARGEKAIQEKKTVTQQDAKKEITSWLK